MDKNLILDIQRKNALRDYIEKSELRIVNDNFRIRMSPEIAKKYDAGVYDLGIAEHAGCINELLALGVKYPAGAKPIFYMYIVPDENLVELLKMPYKNLTCGGKPVGSYDIDGFKSVYGLSQNRLTGDAPVKIIAHINHIHEYAHSIISQFGLCEVLFAEGFAEIIPWYVLDYEKQVPEHLDAILAMKKIYMANELLNNKVFMEGDFPKRCAFWQSYMSAYLFVRVIFENICNKFNLSKRDAVQKFLEFMYFAQNRMQFLIAELAGFLDLDVNKLLYTNEYQKEMLEKIKTNSTIWVKPKEKDR